ncbi:MAG: GxGYxYP domain-containing protein [Armatimonadota bacterium]
MMRTTRYTILLILFLAAYAIGFAGTMPPISRSSKPSKTLTVVNVRSMSPDERLFVVSVQGIVNRTVPRIFINSWDSDTFWLDMLKERKLIIRTVDLDNIKALADMYRNELRGLVVTDPKLRLTVNIATMIAGVDKVAIASPELLERLNMSVKFDLRGKWSMEAEAYEWAYNNLWPRMNPRALSWADPGEAYHLERDYLIQHRIWPLWISGPIDGPTGGADIKTETQWTEKIMRETPGNIPIYGFPSNGENVGIGEMGGTTLASYYGKYNVCTALNPNLSVHSGYPPTNFRPQKPTVIKMDPGKVYIAFILSDGDNLLTFNGYHLASWKQRPTNRPPISWSIGPAAALLMPEIIRWYERTLVPGDTFIADVSGAGYMYPAIYGEKLGDIALLKDYAAFTAKLSRMLGVNTLAIHEFMGTKPRHDEIFANEWPELKGIFSDYTRVYGRTQDESLFKLKGGIPVIHAGIGFNVSADRETCISNAVSDIRKISKQRPAFINGFMVNWYTDPEALAEIMRRLGDDYVAVSPEVLAGFAAKYASPWKESTNLAIHAVVDSPDQLGPGLEVTDELNTRNACDDGFGSYWDDKDGGPEYRLRLRFKAPVKASRMEITGFEHEDHAPKSFDIICDGKLLKTIEDFRYKNNLAVISLGQARFQTIELRIFAWYGGSPAIRELQLFK